MRAASLMQRSVATSRRGPVAAFCFLVFALALPAGARAQANPLSTHSRIMYAGMKAVLLRSAEMVPDSVYGYRPTPAVRTFAQILGHAADSQFYFCSVVRGDTYASRQVERTKHSKAELVAALKDAFAYCDPAYAGMTDALAGELVRVEVFQGDSPKLGVLNTNSLHAAEHYGNLITYMRLNNIVPPTSDPAFMAEMAKKDLASQ